MKKIKELIERDTPLVILLVFFVGICVFMLISFGTTMFNSVTLASIGFQMSEILVLALGMSLCVLLGGIDLSIVATANLASFFAASILSGRWFDVEQVGVAPTILLATVAALVVGLLCGAINGLIISRASVHPIVATLSTMTLYSGLTMGLSGGKAVGGYPAAFLKFGSGKLGPVPYVFIAAMAVFVILVLSLDRTKLGHEIHYIGENHTASRFAGIHNEAVLMKVYSLSGLMAGIAALMIMSRSNSARSGYGDTYQLQAIMVAVLGDISPSGGKGRLYGVLLATFCLQIMQTAFTLWEFSPYSKKLIWGAMLLLVMLLNMWQVWASRRAKIQKLSAQPKAEQA